jgi:hypothetical protein
MRSIGRIFVAAEESDLPVQLALACKAERLGVEGIWVHGPGTGHSDSYAAAVAAAIASTTADLRIGVVLGLAIQDDILRLAEDVAVIDHCSSGRVELWLDGPTLGGEHWRAAAERLVTNLRTCSVGDRELAVTPGLLQPEVAVVARGPKLTITGAGLVVELDAPQRPRDLSARLVLRAGSEQTRAAIAAAGEPDTLRTAVEGMRAAIDTCGAQDLVFVLPGGAGDDGINIVASVLAPILRATEHEVPDLVVDTLKFRRASRAFVREAAVPGSGALR